jgi:hypothetical protein
VLAAAFGAYGGALAVATMLLGRASLALAAGAVDVRRFACGPLLTGGLSSRLAGLAGSGDRAKRRAEGWDAVSYGLAGTLGPAVVAALARDDDAGRPACWRLAGAAVVAAAVVLTLPRGAGRAARKGDPLTVRAALRLVAVARATAPGERRDGGHRVQLRRVRRHRRGPRRAPGRGRRGGRVARRRVRAAATSRDRCSSPPFRCAASRSCSRAGPSP